MRLSIQHAPVGLFQLEVCALPKLPQHRTEQLVGSLLQRAVGRAHADWPGRSPLPVRVMPTELRELPRVQSAVLLEKKAGRRTECRQRERRTREASAVMRANKKSSRRPSGSARSPTGMPGRNMADTSHRNPLPCSPLRSFGPLRINAPERFSVPHTRSLSLAATFHSPSRLPPFGCLHEGSPLPAYRFDSVPDHRIQPVRLVTPGLAARFEPPARGRSK